MRQVFDLVVPMQQIDLALLQRLELGMRFNPECRR